MSSARNSPSQVGPAPSGNLESMFQQILQAVEKSHVDIGELRYECAELKRQNASLERQIREGLQNNNQNNLRPPTPGFMTPSTPPSPQLRATKLSPFLSLNFTNHSTPSPPDPLYRPSPLGGNAQTPFSCPNRDIPGFYVVIPAGGAGTRLWPLSREGHPKFLLDVTLQGRSLIQATWDRLLPLSSASRTAIVAGPGHVDAISEQLPDLLPSNLICEPGPKDSMAAIGLAAAILERRDPDAVIGSFAADHMISGDEAFLSAVAEAVEVARKDYLVTIGIAPSHPSTGFGYVCLGSKLAMKEAPNARLVSSFKEKPDARTAASYIATGKYRWNAGMFVTKASFLLQLLKEYRPEMHESLKKIANVWDADATTRQNVLEEVWPGIEKIAIDNAVAEPAAEAGRVAVVPATFGWDDVGDYSSLAELLPAESGQPRILGSSSLVLTEQAAGGIAVPASGRLVACLGVDDLVIVDMSDTLVTTRARSQEVKRLVKKTRDAGWKHLL